MLRCNPTGATILELLLRRFDQEQITAEFRRRYELSPDSAEADVRAFLTSLQNQGLLRQETARKPEE
jgi:predicted deacylase